MPTIKFSATATASAATSITVPFGGSPAVGDLVVVFLLVDSEIITHQPGWVSEFTATPNPWFKLDGLRAPDSSTLTGWYHTFNASDSGSSAVFTFVPAPTLGIGDKDVSTANAVAVAVVFDGTNSTAVLEHNTYGAAQDSVITIPASPLKLASSMALHAVGVNGSTASFSDSDGPSTLVQSVTLASPAGMSLALFRRTNSPAGYRPSFTLADGAKSLAVLATSVSDNLPQLYNSPYIEEAPMGMNALMARYRLNRYFTVLNNTGTFSAQRYQSTDQIAAATQVFVNNQPITSTDRTNLLNSGVGGDFQAVS
jgi:hypothetical protein